MLASSQMAHQQYQADLILKHALRTATPFSSPEGQAWASIPNGIDAHSVWPVRSSDFRDWLASSYLKEHETLPRQRSLLEAIRLFEALALRSEMAVPPVA